MKETTITCDGCGKEISVSTGMPANYHLELSVENRVKPGSMGDVFCVQMYPPIKRTHHFHGLQCLNTWMEQGEK